MFASDVMTRQVATVRPDTAVAEAVRLMLDRRVSALPVVDVDGRPVGMLSEGDLLRRSETGTATDRPNWLEVVFAPGRLANAYVHAHGRRVEEVMTRDVASVAEGTPLDEVVRLMEKNGIKRVPVLRDGCLVGIVSRADLLRALGRVLSAGGGPAAAGDAAIRERIIAELGREPWGPKAGVTIVVTDGVVDLQGIILDERQRDAIRVVAENAAGVKVVHDHLVWVEPNSGYAFAAPGSDPIS